MTTFFRSLIASLALGLVIGAATPAHAQSTDTAVVEHTAAWTQQFEQQMVQLLRTPDAARTEGAMQLIIHYAQLDDTNGEPVYRFTRATPQLLDIYKQSDNQGRRLLALAALHAIDHEPALKEVAATLRSERSDVVRQRALHMLSARLQQ